jgi:hypothetical protein
MSSEEGTDRLKTNLRYPLKFLMNKNIKFEEIFSLTPLFCKGALGNTLENGCYLLSYLLRTFSSKSEYQQYNREVNDLLRQIEEKINNVNTHNFFFIQRLLEFMVEKK